MVSTTVAAALLTIALSTDGHWLAERPGIITIMWTAPEHATEAELRWELSLGAAKLAEGRLTLEPADEPLARRIAEPMLLSLTPPAVRVRTALRWRYTLHAIDDGRLLAQGERTIHVYPDNQLAGVADRLAEPVTVLAEADAPLLAILEEAGVPHRRIDTATTLQLARPGIVLVAPDRLTAGDRRAEAAALTQLVRTGTGVMTFEQRDIDRIMGFRLRRRPMPDRLAWQDEHALWSASTPADRASWLAGQRDVWAIEVAADQPALALAHWPMELDAAGEMPAIGPVDALVVTQTIGRGRVVLWQIPLGPWDVDPRSQRLLANALDYLATPPGPTPPLRDRLKQPAGADDNDTTSHLFRERTRP